MLIKRFEGEDNADALRKVREAFGPDALVLETKTLRKGRSWLGQGSRPIVEITAAIDREQLAPETPTTAGMVQPDPSWRPLQLSRAVVEPLEGELRTLRVAVEELRDRERRERSLGREIEELRRVARRLTQAGPQQGGGRALQDYCAAGLPEEIAEDIASVVEHRVRVGEKRAVATVECLAERIEPRLALPRHDAHSTTLWVGAAGAGKTTTLAKVAARSAEQQARVVTTDVEKWGGVEMLRGLAGRFGIEVDVAQSAEELRQHVRAARRRRELVMVDSGGHSLRDVNARERLIAYRRALGAKASVQLVVSATTQAANLRAQLSHYAPLALDGVVLSKVDDCLEIGGALSTLLADDAPPLTYVTTGQRVPEDLQVPEPYELAEHAMGATAHVA